MDFDLAEQNYVRLEKLRRSGQIAADDYRTQLGALRVVDAHGRTWMVQEQPGQWHVWDGVAWQPAAPEGRAGVIRVAVAQPAVAPAPATPPTAPPPAALQPTSGPPPYAGRGVSRAAAVGYVGQPAVPPNIALARRRPGCLSITFRMLLWALVWFGAAYAVHALPQSATPWWGYLLVGLGALGTLMLWIRRMTRHGRALRRLARGGAA